MRRSSTVARLVGLILTCAFASGVVSGAGGDGLVGPRLTVRDDADRVLAAFALTDDPRWHLEWRHSVTGIVVRDFYAFLDGVMILTHSHTPAFDAGLGHIPGRGRVESDGEGGYWIYDLDEAVPGNAYLLRVGSERVAHTLVHVTENETVRVNLSALAAGTRVRVGVEVP